MGVAATCTMALCSLSGVDVTDDGLAVGGVGGQVEVLLLLMSHCLMTTRRGERRPKQCGRSP